MLNFKKLFIIRIISTIVLVTFTVTSTCYGIDLPDKMHLRPNLTGNSKEGKQRLQEALSLVSEQQPGSASGLLGSLRGQEPRLVAGKILEDIRKEFLQRFSQLVDSATGCLVSGRNACGEISLIAAEILAKYGAQDIIIVSREEGLGYHVWVECIWNGSLYIVDALAGMIERNPVHGKILKVVPPAYDEIDAEDKSVYLGKRENTTFSYFFVTGKEKEIDWSRPDRIMLISDRSQDLEERYRLGNLRDKRIEQSAILEALERVKGLIIADLKGQTLGFFYVAQRLKISVNSAEKALDELVKEGILVRKGNRYDWVISEVADSSYRVGDDMDAIIADWLVALDRGFKNKLSLLRKSLFSYLSRHKASLAYIRTKVKSLKRGEIGKAVNLTDLILGQDKKALSFAVFSPDGTKIATAGSDNSYNAAIIWDIATGKPIYILKGHPSEVESIAWSPDGAKVAIVHDNGRIAIWDIAKIGQEKESYRGTAILVDSTGNCIVGKHWIPAVRSVAFSPDGTKLAAASILPENYPAIIWDASTLEPIHILRGHKDDVMSVVFSPNGTKIATTSFDHTAIIWDVSTGKPINTLEGHKDYVVSVAFSPDGKKIATASIEYERPAIIWDLETGKPIHTLEGHAAPGVSFISFSPDGEKVATASQDKTVRVSSLKEEFFIVKDDETIINLKTGLEQPKYILGEEVDKILTAFARTKGSPLELLKSLVDNANYENNPISREDLKAARGFSDKAFYYETKSLEDIGLLKSMPDPNDRRKKLYFLTTRLTKKQMEALDEAIPELDRYTLTDLSEKEITRIRQIVKSLISGRKAVQIEQPAALDKISVDRNWSDPDDLTLCDFKYGVVKRKDYHQIYSQLEEILNKLWLATDTPKDKAPELILIEEALPDHFVSDDSHIYISLGLLKEIRNQRKDEQYPKGVIYQEDLAFVLSFELAYYFQKKQGIKMENQHQLHAAIRDADRRAFDLMEDAGYSIQYVFDIFPALNKSKSYHNRGFLMSKVQKMIELIQGGKLDELFKDKTSLEIMEEFFDSFLPMFERFSGITLSEEQAEGLKKVLASQDIPQLVKSIHALKINREKAAKAVSGQIKKLSEVDIRKEAQRLWESQLKAAATVRQKIREVDVSSVREKIKQKDLRGAAKGIKDKAQGLLKRDIMFDVKKTARTAFESALYKAFMMQLNFLLQTLIELSLSGVVHPDQVKRAREIVAQTDIANMSTVDDVVEFTKQLMLVFLKEETVDFMYNTFPDLARKTFSDRIQNKTRTGKIIFSGAALSKEQKEKLKSALKKIEITSLKDIADLIRSVLSIAFNQQTTDFVYENMPQYAWLRFSTATQGKLSDAQKETAVKILKEAHILNTRDVLNLIRDLLGIFLNEHLVDFVFTKIESAYQSFAKKTGEKQLDKNRKLSEERREKITDTANPKNINTTEDIFALINKMLSGMLNEEMALFAFNYLKTRLGINPEETSLSEAELEKIRQIMMSSAFETEQDLIDALINLLGVISKKEENILKEITIFIETGADIYKAGLLPDEKIELINKILESDRIYTVTDIIGIIHSVLSVVMNQDTADSILSSVLESIGSIFHKAVSGRLPERLEDGVKETLQSAEFKNTEDLVMVIRRLMGFVVKEDVVNFVFEGIPEPRLLFTGRALSEEQHLTISRILTQLGTVKEQEDIASICKALLETVLEPDVAELVLGSIDLIMDKMTKGKLSISQLEEIRALLSKAEIKNPQQVIELVVELRRIISNKHPTIAEEALSIILEKAKEFIKTRDLNVIQIDAIKAAIQKYAQKEEKSPEDLTRLIEELMTILMTPNTLNIAWGLVGERFESLLQFTSDRALFSKVSEIIENKPLETYQDYIELIKALLKLIVSEKTADVIIQQLMIKTDLLLKTKLGQKVPEEIASKLRAIIQGADTKTLSGVTNMINSFLSIFNQGELEMSEAAGFMKGMATRKLDQMSERFKFNLPVATVKALAPGKKKAAQDIIAESQINDIDGMLNLIDKLLPIIMDEPDAEKVSAQIRGELAPFIKFYAKTGLTARQLKAIKDKLSSADFNEPNDISRLIYELVFIVINGRLESRILDGITQDLSAALPESGESELPKEKRNRAKKMISSAKTEKADDVLELIHNLLTVITEREKADALFDALTEKYSGVLEACRREGKLPKSAQEELKKILKASSDIKTAGDILKVMRSLMAVLVSGRAKDFTLDELEAKLKTFLPKYAGEILSHDRKENIKKILRNAKYEKPQDALEIAKQIISEAMDEEAAGKILSELSTQLEPVIKLYGEEGLRPEQIEAIKGKLKTERIENINTSGEAVKLAFDILSILATEKAQETIIKELHKSLQQYLPKSAGKILSGEKIDDVKKVLKGAKYNKPEDILSIIKELLFASMDKDAAEEVFSELSAKLDPVIKVYGEEGLTPEQINAIGKVIEKFKTLAEDYELRTSGQVLELALELVTILANEKFQDFIAGKITRELEPLLPEAASMIFAANKRVTVKKILSRTKINEPQDILVVIRELLSATMDKDTADALFSDMSRQLDPIIKMYGAKGLTPRQIGKIKEMFNSIDYDEAGYEKKIIHDLSAILIQGTIRHQVSIEIAEDIKRMVLSAKKASELVLETQAQGVKIAETDVLHTMRSLLLIILDEPSTDALMDDIKNDQEVVFKYIEEHGIPHEVSIEIMAVLKSETLPKTMDDIVGVLHKALSLLISRITEEAVRLEIEDVFEDNASFLEEEDEDISAEKSKEAILLLAKASPKYTKEFVTFMRDLIEICMGDKASWMWDKLKAQYKDILHARNNDFNNLSDEQLEALRKLSASTRYIDTRYDGYNLACQLMAILLLENRRNSAIGKLEVRTKSIATKSVFKSRKLIEEQAQRAVSVLKLDRIDDIIGVIKGLLLAVTDEAIADEIIGKFIKDNEILISGLRENGLLPGQMADISEILTQAHSFNAPSDVITLAAELMSVIIDKTTEDFVLDKISRAVEYRAPVFTSLILSDGNKKEIKRIIKEAEFKTPQDVLEALHKLARLTMKKEAADALMSDIAGQIEPFIKLYGDEGLTARQAGRIREVFESADLDNPQFMLNIVHSLVPILLEKKIQESVALTITKELEPLLVKPIDEALSEPNLEKARSICGIDIVKDIDDAFRIMKELLLVVIDKRDAERAMDKVIKKNEALFAIYKEEGLPDYEADELLELLGRSNQIKTPRDIVNMVSSMFGILIKQSTEDYVLDQLSQKVEILFPRTVNEILSDDKRESAKKIIKEAHIEKPADVLKLIDTLLAETMGDHAVAYQAFSELSARLEPVVKMYGEEGLSPQQIEDINKILEGQDIKDIDGLVNMINELIGVIVTEKFAISALSQIAQNLEKNTMIAGLNNFMGSLRGRVDKGVSFGEVESPYLDTHPPDEERLARLKGYKETKYFQHFHAKPEQIAQDVFSELENPTQARLDMSVLENPENTYIIERIESKDSWQEIIFFVAMLSSESRSADLYRYLMGKLRKDKMDKLERDMFSFQLNFLFGKPELNTMLELFKNKEDFITYIPILPEAIRQDKLDDETYREVYAKRLADFMKAYNQYIYGIIKNILDPETEPGKYINILLERYEKVFEMGLVSDPAPFMDMLLGKLQLYQSLNSMDSNSVMRLLKLRQLVFPSSAVLNPFFDTLIYHQLHQNESFVKEFVKRQVGSLKLANVFYEGMEKEFQGTDFPGLGKTYEETIESLYFMFFEMEQGSHVFLELQEKLPALQKKFFEFWIKAVYDKFKPHDDDGSYTFTFVNFVSEFLNKKNVNKYFYSHALLKVSEIPFSRGEKKKVLLFDQPVSERDFGREKDMREVLLKAALAGFKEEDSIEVEFSGDAHRWRYERVQEIHIYTGKIVDIAKSGGFWHNLFIQTPDGERIELHAGYITKIWGWQSELDIQDTKTEIRKELVYENSMQPKFKDDTEMMTALTEALEKAGVEEGKTILKVQYGDDTLDSVKGTVLHLEAFIKGKDPGRNLEIVDEKEGLRNIFPKTISRIEIIGKKKKVIYINPKQRGIMSDSFDAAIEIVEALKKSGLKDGDSLIVECTRTQFDRGEKGEGGLQIIEGLAENIGMLTRTITEEKEDMEFLLDDLKVVTEKGQDWIYFNDIRKIWALKKISINSAMKHLEKTTDTYRSSITDYLLTHVISDKKQVNGLLEGKPREWLDNLSLEALDILYLLSRGVILEFEELSEKYLYKMPSKEVWTLYVLIKEYFTPQLIAELNISVLHEPSIGRRLGELEGSSLALDVPYASPSIKTFNDYLLNMFIYIAHLAASETKKAVSDYWHGRGAEGKREKLMYETAFLTPGSGHYGGHVFSDIFAGEVASDRNNFARIKDILAGYDTPPVPRLRIQINGLQDFTEWDARRKFLELNMSFHWVEQALESLDSTYSRYSHKKISWEKRVDIICSCIPPSVVRNYFLYYQFCEEVLPSPGRELYEGDNLFLNNPGLEKEIARTMGEEVTKLTKDWAEDPEFETLTRDEPAEFLRKFSYMMRYFVKDSFIEALNQNDAERYLLYYAYSLSLGDFDIVERMTPQEETHYEKYKEYFEDTGFNEFGTRFAYLDLQLGGYFKKHLTRIINDELRENETKLSFEEKIALIKDIFPRQSNARDSYLQMLLDTAQMESISTAALKKILVMMNNSRRKDCLNLELLEREVAAKPDISFKEELKKIVKYFPEKSYFRDDILVSFEQKKVSTPTELEEVRKLLTSDISTTTEEDVARRQEVIDNISMVLGKLSVKAKIEVLAWFIGGGVSEKPDVVKKLELITFTKFDNLFNGGLEANGRKDIRYAGVGNKERGLFFEMLLVSGENSIIAGGHAMTLIEQIVKIIYKDMGISEEQAKDSKKFKIMAMLLNSFVKHMGHDPKRLSRILISIVDQMERLHNDPSFSSAGPDLKLAKILKVFLESIGVVGIKMGQFLSAATVIKLPQELRDELKQLTDNAAPLDLASIFSILAAVGKGDVAIEMILGSASIKTSFKVKGTNRILKIKKLQVYYEALQDIVLLDNILKDMQEAGLITEKDRGFAVSEIRKMVEEESDFERERQNAKRLGENYDKRLDNSLYKIIYWVIGKILGIDKFAFHFSQVIDVIDNMIIEEEFIPGVSLKDYKGDDKRAIYLAVLVELLREVLFDKFFHADPHAGNILIGQGTEAAKINFIDMGDAGETSLKRGLATAAFLLIPILIDRFKLNPSSRMWILLNKISRSLEKDVHPSMVKFFGKITYLLEKPEVTIASAAHFSLFSKSNSHTGQGRADVFLIEGQKEFGVADTQRIQSLHVLTTIPPKDTDTNTTFTIRGPPGGEERIRLTQYIKDNLINAIFRSKSLHDGDFDEDIAIVLADKYDYIAGDHKDNNIIILNASDLEKMLAREEDPAFINELIVSILSEELAHERGADNNIAAEERLAEACASGTIGSFSDKQLREYIAFVGRNTRDMEGQYGYSTYLTQKGEDASARRLVENLPTIGRPPTITPESVEKGVELLKTQQKKLTVPNLAKVMGVNKYSLWLAHREGRIDLNRHGFRVKKIAERDTVTDENIGAAVQALQKEGIQQPGIEDIARALKVALSAIYSAQSKGVIHLERYDIAYNKDYASQGLITIENIARVIVDKKLKKPISIGQLTEALGVSDSAIRASIRRGRLSPKELQTLGVKIKQGTSLDVPFDDSIEQTYKSLRQAAESI